MKKVVIWIALSLWSVMTVFAGETAYLFSYFINDSKDGLHLAYSYVRIELAAFTWRTFLSYPCGW